MSNNKKNTILVVDDDPQIQKMMRLLLDSEDFKIIQSESGKQALRLCVSTKPDLVILSLKVSNTDDRATITAIREWSQVPIIVISLRAADEDIAEVLNMGANDYVIKPFNLDVLLARINASLRATAVRDTGESELCNGPLRMDLMRHEVYLNGGLVSFTPKEYELLRHFMLNRGKMLTHKEILRKVWGDAHGSDITYLRVYIGQIRDKIEDISNLLNFITTEPGVGYRMEVLPAIEPQLSLVAL